MLSQKGAELDKYLNYLRQFSTNNVILVQAGQFNKSIDMLVVPNVSALTSSRYRDLPSVDPQFFTFLNDGLFNAYTGENINIMSFGYGALSIFNRLGNDLVPVVGYDTDKQVAVIVDKDSSLTHIKGLNDHIYANICDMRHSFDTNSHLDGFPSFVAKKASRAPQITGVATSFIRPSGESFIAGCLHNPLAKENLQSSYDCRLMGYSVGDHISNLLIKNMLL